MILLIAGGSAVGKSTIASAVAKNLGIAHIIGTDFIREVVRNFVPRTKNPYLHKSTYEAFFDPADSLDMSERERLVSGFMLQREEVIPSIKSIVERSIAESRDAVIEGVHISPECAANRGEAFIVLRNLSIADLEARYEGRKNLPRMRKAGRSIEEIARCSHEIGHLIESEFTESKCEMTFIDPAQNRDAVLGAAIDYAKQVFAKQSS